MLRGVILFLVSVVCSIPLAPIGLISGFFKKDYLVNVAISIDQTMNVIMNPILNLIMIKDKNVKFGNPDQTISYVIGRNWIDNNLTNFGRFWRWFLDTIEVNHCLIAVIKEEGVNPFEEEV